jgi:hypothetical protein
MVSNYVYVLTSWDPEIEASEYVAVFERFRDVSEYAIRYFNHESHSIRVDAITLHHWDVNLVVVGENSITGKYEDKRHIKVGTILEEWVR